jgi:hypothetical protein
MAKPGLEAVMATALAAPQAAAASPARAGPFRPGRNDRDFRIALGLSVVLHVVVFATVSFHFRIEPVVPQGPLVVFRFEDAMQAYDIEPVTVGFGMPEPEPLAAGPAPIPVPLPAPQPMQPPLTTGAEGGAAGRVAGTPGGGTGAAAEARPRSG